MTILRKQARGRDFASALHLAAWRQVLHCSNKWMQFNIAAGPAGPQIAFVIRQLQSGFVR